MAWVDDLLDSLGARLAHHITIPKTLPPRHAAAIAPYMQELRAGDVLLLDGGATNIATAIKYLTQSTWSHAALCTGRDAETGEPALIEAEIGLGIIRSPLRKYAGFHMRICRPVGLTEAALAEVIGFAEGRIGGRYDLRNVLDLARWLFPMPPVPLRMRRRMIALGSGEPTRAICASLIAEAFNRIGDKLKPHHFYDPVHGRIFAVCSDLIGRGKLADGLTLREWFQREGGLQEIGGAGYLLVLMENAARLTTQARDYADLVYDLALRRDLIRIGGEITHLAAVPPEDILSINTPEDLAEVDRIYRSRPAPSGLIGREGQ
jgi:hypothetical protein